MFVATLGRRAFSKKIRIKTTLKSSNPNDKICRRAFSKKIRIKTCTGIVITSPTFKRRRAFSKKIRIKTEAL